MSAFDANRDGRLSTREMLDQMEFRYADRDDDGVLNRKEFAKIEDPEKFDQYDTNRDSLISPVEYAKGEAAQRTGAKISQ